MRTLSLSKAAYDVPVTGKPFAGTKQQGLHSFYCSSDAIWGVHVSRPTGISLIVTMILYFRPLLFLQSFFLVASVYSNALPS